MLLQFASFHGFGTERTVNVGVELSVVLLQLCPWYGLVTPGAQGDVPGTVEAVHHVALSRDISPAATNQA